MGWGGGGGAHLQCKSFGQKLLAQGRLVFGLLLYVVYSFENSKIVGELSPATRLETSFDSAEATRSVDNQAVSPAGPAVNEESDALAAATHDKVKLSVVQFAEEDPILKWFLRVMSVMLLICLVFLWIYYR